MLLYIATSHLCTPTRPCHVYVPLKTLTPLHPLQFLSCTSLLGPSTVPYSKWLPCIISSRLLTLYGLSSPISSPQLSASCLNPNSRRLLGRSTQLLTPGLLLPPESSLCFWSSTLPPPASHHHSTFYSSARNVGNQHAPLAVTSLILVFFT